MSTDDINNNIAKAYAEMYNKPEAQEIVEVDINEDNTNDVSDDGDGMDKVQPKALKKKFKDRKDKDLDNDGDEDESDEYLHNRRKTVKKAVDKKDDGSVLEYSKEKHTKKEGIIDRMLAGRNKEGSKKWVTKKPQTKESVEPGFLMKRIQEKATANNVSKDDTRDSFDKQLAGRRIDDVAPASSGMTEAEFVKMHSPENANTPEFADAPVVFTKTLQDIKNSVKSKSPIRHNDSTIGESAEIKEKENDMNEGMTPMQRALAKVKAQSKDKVSVKKAPWDKDDVKKESVELDEAKGEKPFVGASDGKSWAVNISGVKGGNLPRNLGWQISNRDIISAFKKDAKSTYADAKGKPTIPAVKKHLKMLGATEYYANWKSDSSSYKDDSVQIWYKDDVKKESVELENVNEMYIGQQWHKGNRRSDGIATNLNWYSDLNRLLKRLEDDMQDRKKRLRQELGGSSNSAYEKENSFAIIKGHIDPTIKAIADVKKTLPPVVKAWAKAYNEAKDADTAVDIIMRKTPAERGHK